LILKLLFDGASGSFPLWLSQVLASRASMEELTSDAFVFGKVYSSSEPKALRAIPPFGSLLRSADRSLGIIVTEYTDAYIPKTP
jgi:hypothetical protein